MMAPPRGRSPRALAAAGFLVLAQTAFAEETPTHFPTQSASGDDAPVALQPRSSTDLNVTALAVNVGIGETDNVNRTSANTQAQTLALVGTDFELKRTGQRLGADLKGDFNYVDYVQSAYGPKLLGRFDGSGGWQIWPERLRWVLEDSYGESQLDPLTAVTPNNLEHVNVVSTGPDLTLRPASNLFVKLGARDSYTQYQTSPFDNNRILANASVGDDLSVASSASLNADFQRIRFKNTVVNSDFDRRNFYAAYTAKGARTELIVDLGVSQEDDYVPWRTTPFVRIDIRRAVSAASVIQLTLGRQYTDASDSFRGLQSGATGRIAIAPTAVTSANYLEQYATLAWRLDRNRTSLGVSASWEKDTYPSFSNNGVVVLPDVSRATGEVRLARRMTSVLTAEVSGHVAHEKFLDFGFSDNDYLGSAALKYRAGRRLDFSLHYDHESHIASVAAARFIENRAMLTIGYQLLP